MVSALELDDDDVTTRITGGARLAVGGRERDRVGLRLAAVRGEKQWAGPTGVRLARAAVAFLFFFNRTFSFMKIAIAF